MQSGGHHEPGEAIPGRPGRQGTRERPGTGLHAACPAAVAVLILLRTPPLAAYVVGGEGWDPPGPARAGRRRPGAVVSGDVTSEVDELTIAALALIEGVGVTKAEIRRRLPAGACAQAREDPHVAVIVEASLAARDARRDKTGNVVRLADRSRA